MSVDHRKIELVMSLRNQGIRDMRVLEAIERTPRELFLEGPFLNQAYADQALPISCGQTISQPFIVAYMTDRLKLDSRHKVLEVGTGSGYQAAILSPLCRRVYTIERYRTLAKAAGERFRALGLSNITQMVGDGMKGWPKQAPFDRIIVTAAAKEIPEALFEQLAIGGVMVLPLEEKPGAQKLWRVTRDEQGLEREELLPVRFVPLVEGVAKEL
ncbi:MAG: protein-L-isoaspartate(D-aspartate) O-methyltransferase [Hyphomicrobiales bacterium]